MGFRFINRVFICVVAAGVENRGGLNQEAVGATANDWPLTDFEIVAGAGRNCSVCLGRAEVR